MTSTSTLAATVLRDGKRGPVTILFCTATRQDPAVPYIATDEYREDYHRKPGLKRNRSVALIIPARPRYDEPIAVYRAALKFQSVQELDALIEQLAELRPHLTATFPANPDDTAVIIDGEHLVCPCCGAKDTITGRQSATRRVAVALAPATGVARAGIVAKAIDGDGEEGRYFFDVITCGKCGNALYLPDDATVNR
ncbi:hypothetical protein ACQP2T_61710 [Nonomuraea sp. CA-143628]|uniref:hypothetical protein n=1 Tax=Nonomuraea sp. CA-143628 TaxID=3239997 RepID=UPI003D90FDC1